MAALTAQLPGQHILLNETIDGTFPVHHPDPTVPKNLVQLIDTVRSEGCDMGFAFDGDGDRIGLVDSQGEILWGDQIMLLLAREILSRKPGSTIIADVKASQVLFDEIERAGGVPLMWNTGHSLIKSKMVEEKAPFAGEMSAHIFFADGYYGFDAALYAAVRVMNIAGNSEETLEQFRESLPKVVQHAGDPLPLLGRGQGAGHGFDQGTPHFRRCGHDRYRRRAGQKRRWLVAASRLQHQDVLVARCEPPTKKGLERLKREVAAQLTASGLTPPEF